MDKNYETKEKICAFYASDYHFEMMSLPYIDKNIDNNKEVIVLTQNNLEDTVGTLISNVNLKDIKKEKLLNLNWKNDDRNKFKEIEENSKSNKDMVILIKGNVNYIKNIHENIKQYQDKNGKIKIVDCYDIQEIGESIDLIMDKYQKVLNVSGEKEIQKI